MAVGGRQEAGLEHVITFRDAEAQELHDRVVGDVVAGRARSVAFVLPEGPVHPLPLYELALMTAARAWDAAVSRPEIHLVTPEPAPLAVFGAGASAAVGGVLGRPASVFTCRPWRTSRLRAGYSFSRKAPTWHRTGSSRCRGCSGRRWDGLPGAA